ncbi:MAG: hypothetical protein ACT4N2_14350 [Hyphomicrobium sp.]
MLDQLEFLDPDRVPFIGLGGLAVVLIAVVMLRRRHRRSHERRLPVSIDVQNSAQPEGSTTVSTYTMSAAASAGTSPPPPWAAQAIRLPVADFVLDDTSPAAKTYSAAAILAAGEAAGYRVQRAGSANAGSQQAQRVSAPQVEPSLTASAAATYAAIAASSGRPLSA